METPLTSLVLILLSVLCLFFVSQRWHRPKHRLPSVVMRLRYDGEGASLHVPPVASETATDVLRTLSGVKKRKQIRCGEAASGRLLGLVPEMDAMDVRSRVQAAREAQGRWKRTSYAERRRVLRALRRAFLANRERILQASVQETGKTLVDAQLGEMLTTLEKIRWLLRQGERALAPEYRSVGPFTLHKRAFVQFEPLGVIAAIAPWNYPFHNLMNPILAALFAGNAIVVKCSEYSSWCSVHYVDLVRQVLAACGHPPELVQLVTGRAAAGNALVTDPGVDKVFFTGSTAVGRQVAKAAAEKLKPCVLELGGKDALIICDDADLEQATAISMRGVFQNSGQNCVGVERILVQRSRYEGFVTQMERQVRSLRLGEDLGAMTMGEAALRHMESLVADAVARGANLLCGGKATRQFYWEPTLLCDVPSESRILREEVFGPVMVIIPFDHDEEAIQIVNACPFGLGSSVFTANRSRAANIRNQLVVGMVNENDFGVNYLCQSLPFGGTKDSGSDRFAGIEGLRGCCLMKSVTQDRFWCFRTRIPASLQYPIGPRAPAFLDALIRFIYIEDDIWARLSALVALLRPSLEHSTGNTSEVATLETEKLKTLSQPR